MKERLEDLTFRGPVEGKRNRADDVTGIDAIKDIKKKGEEVSSISKSYKGEVAQSHDRQHPEWTRYIKNEAT